MRRLLRLLLEFIAAFIGIAVVLGLLLVWRLSAKPTSSTFLTPYIADAIGELIPGAHAEASHSLLKWDNTDYTIALHLEDLHLTGEDGVDIADVPSIDIQLSVLGLLFGRLTPSVLSIDHPQVNLEREADGTLLFGGMAAHGHGTGNLKQTLKSVADDLRHGFMRKLQIERAVFDIHDDETESDWSVSIPETVLERMGGEMEGSAKVEVTQKDATSLLAVHYAYDDEKEQHILTARFSDIDPSFFAAGHPHSPATILNLPLTGEISLGFDPKLNLVAGSLDIHGDRGVLNYPEFWDLPLEVQSLDLKASYDHLKLDVSQATLDLGGPVLSLQLTGQSPISLEQTKQTSDFNFDTTITLDHVPMDKFGSLWPKPAIPSARSWIITNLSKGQFNHAEASFKGILNLQNIDDLVITEGNGKVSATGAQVHYLPDMPPVAGADAVATFDLDHMTAELTSGSIGNIKLLASTVEITDFQKSIQNIHLPLHISTPIPDALAFIDAPRFGFAKAIGLKPDEIGGTADLNLNLQFPLLRNLALKDIKFGAKAHLSNMSSSNLVPKLNLTQGSLGLDLDDTGFSLMGSVELNKVPFEISWQQAFHESSGRPLRKAEISGAVDGEQWTQLGLGVLGKTQGSINVSLQLLEKDKTATSISGSLDMKGAEMEVDQLNWKKPAGVPALLKFAADMQNGKDINVTSIDVTGTDIAVKGNAVLSSDLAPVSLDLSPIVLGRTNAALHFSQAPGDKGTLKFDVEGQSFDVSGLRGGKDPARADPRPKEYHLKLNKLYTSDFGFIQNADAYAVRDHNGWSEISLHGLANGGPQLDIGLTAKDNNRRIFLATCDDFGRALKALGFTDTVTGGKVRIEGESVPSDPELIEGTVRIGGFEVKNLPALALLINATSPFGIMGIFTGTMDFDHLKGEFKWQDDQIELIRVNTSGPSVGMNVDGKVDMDTGETNVNGTIVPFSLVNRVLGSIPLIGDVITGGKNQGVLAVAYSITGPISNPTVSVNPVSLLTPGFLRNLFFGGNENDETPPPPAPEQKPAQPAQSNINK